MGKFFLGDKRKNQVSAQTGAAGLRRSFAGGKTPCRKEGKFFLGNRRKDQVSI
jgi:hypothetical protein